MREDSWARNASSKILQLGIHGALIIFYVSFETTGALLTSHALKWDARAKFKPLPSNMTVVNALLSFTIGSLLTAVIAYRSERSFGASLKALKAAFAVETISKFSLVAACFTTQGVFSYLAYSRLDAGLKKTLDQLRLPATAALSSIIVGRRYNSLEWLALMIVFLSICSFYYADVAHDEITELHRKCHYPQSCFEGKPLYETCAVRVDGPLIIGTAIRNTSLTGTHHDLKTFPIEVDAMDSIGLVFSLIGLCCSVAGSLFAEKLMKQSAEVPYPTQRLQMEATGLPVSIAIAFIVPLWIDHRDGQAIWWKESHAEGSGGGFFQGFTLLTFVVIAINMTYIWLGGMVTKHFSAVVSKISGCVTLVLTVLLSGTILKPCEADPLPVTMFAMSCSIAGAIMIFGMLPKEEIKPPPAVTPSCTTAPAHVVLIDKEPCDTESTVQLEGRLSGSHSAV